MFQKKSKLLLFKLDMSTRGKKTQVRICSWRFASLATLNCLCRAVGWLWKHPPAITLIVWDEFCYFPSAHSSVPLFLVGFWSKWWTFFSLHLLKAGIFPQRVFFSLYAGQKRQSKAVSGIRNKMVRECFKMSNLPVPIGALTVLLVNTFHQVICVVSKLSHVPLKNIVCIRTQLSITCGSLEAW